MSVSKDRESRMHEAESNSLHRTLRAHVAPNAKLLSEYITNTALFASTTRPCSSQEIVIDMTRTILTILNKPNGARNIGFDVDGALPKAMVIADVQGQTMGFHARNHILIREICASFYGSPAAGFGNANLLRSRIDDLAKLVEPDGSSLLLVLAAPFGTGQAERYWRLCSVTPGAAGERTNDSRWVLSSNMRPSSVIDQGDLCSVLGIKGEGLVPEPVVQSMLASWRAVDLDASETTPEIGGGDQVTTKQDAKLVKVLSGVIAQLKASQKRDEETIVELRSTMKTEIELRVKETLAQQAKVWKTEIELLNKEIAKISNALTKERVLKDTLMEELVRFDTTEMQKMKAAFEAQDATLRDVRGQALVDREASSAIDKKLADARRKEGEARKRREELEATVETQARQLSTLRVELEATRTSQKDSKRESSTRLADLVEGQSKLQQRVKELEKKLQQANGAREVAEAAMQVSLASAQKSEVALDDVNAKRFQLEATLATMRHVLRFTCGVVASQSRKLKGMCDLKTPSVSEMTSTRDTGLDDGADVWAIVARSKGMISQLESFVEVIQSGTHCTHGATPPSSPYPYEYPEHDYHESQPQVVYGAPMHQQFSVPPPRYYAAHGHPVMQQHPQPFRVQRPFRPMQR